MPEPELLSRFFRTHGGKKREEFLEEFNGAFLLFRHQGAAPQLQYLPKRTDFKLQLGSEEDVGLEFDDPTLDPIHALFSYHEGFRGWTIEDLGTSFGTHVGTDRISAQRPHLLTDRVVIKPGGGLTEIQFYLADTLYQRMTKAGITRSLRRRRGLDVEMDAKPTPKNKPAPPVDLSASDSGDELLDDDATPRPD